MESGHSVSSIDEFTAKIVMWQQCIFMGNELRLSNRRTCVPFNTCDWPIEMFKQASLRLPCIANVFVIYFVGSQYTNTYTHIPTHTHATMLLLESERTETVAAS